jgi:Family of unknown function (DUF5681)
MSRTGGRGLPPVESRFRKGQSGNPKGRPRKTHTAKAASAFDIIIDRTLIVTQGGSPRAVTVEEALQHRTFEDAVAGSRSAGREVLKMIARREQYLAAHTPAAAMRFGTRVEIDPENADAALLILGIASENPERQAPYFEGQLLLEPWAVQAALSRRRGGKRLSQKEQAEIRRCSRDPDSLRWPRGTGK